MLQINHNKTVVFVLTNACVPIHAFRCVVFQNKTMYSVIK